MFVHYFIPVLMAKKINLFTLFLIFLTFFGQKVLAQLPDPQNFCSHYKTHLPLKRAIALDYEQHDIFDIHFYHLSINAETDNTYLSGSVELQAQAKTDIDTIYLELSSVFHIDSIQINAKPCDHYYLANDILYLIPTEIITNESFFSAQVFYNGIAPTVGQGRGYNNANTNHNTRASWTLSEPFYAKDWWPCKQDLKDKADSVWVFITTDKKNKAGSNGILTASIPLADNKIRYEWKSNYPIAYYLISIAVAEYMEYSFMAPIEDQKEVWMQNYLYPDSLMYKSQKALIDCTKIQMNLLSEKYGNYPFEKEKYGHCITPIGGGMEHQTMTTQKNFSWHLTIHEMGHSWFGNNVTCERWNDIWINEGFATYTQFIGLESMASVGSAQAFMAAMQSVVMREPGGSVYVPDEELEDRDRIFSGRLSYYKGAVIIHMIRYLLNDDELFYGVLKEFQKRYAYQTATAEDFKIVLEELSQQDFDEFFHLWYYGEGYPIYQFEWKQNVNFKLNLSIKQSASSSVIDFFPMKYNMQIYFEDGSDTLIQIDQNKKEQELSLGLHKLVKAILPNPKSWNLMDVEQVSSALMNPGIITIEPNPAHHTIIIRFANFKKNRTIEFYNSALQLVKTMPGNEKLIRVDINSFSQGIYFLKIKSDEAEQLEKLIVY